MQRNQKTLEDYFSEDRAEPEVPGKVVSISETEQEGGNAYDNLIDLVVEEENLQTAIKKVVENRGAPGVDGITVDLFAPWFALKKDSILEQIRSGGYVPKPVRRVEIPKPSGGVRNLGIPCVIDRVIQQAIVQVLTPIYEPTFSDSSFGFRPGRGAHDALRRAQSYVQDGYGVMVDIDISKFFDNLCHDLMMNILRERIHDKCLITLIKRYLRAGIVLPEGICIPSEKGSPQGGNLSPLLSNIYLDKLDKLLDERGHKYCRYADDLAIFVRSKRAGERVFESVKGFLEGKLKLKVNPDKSHVDTPAKLKYLGFKILRRKGKTYLTIHPESLARFKKRVIELTKRNRGRSFESIVVELNRFVRGWGNYYGIVTSDRPFEDLDEWIRRRLRQYKFKLLKTPKARKAFLLPLCPEYLRPAHEFIPEEWVKRCFFTSSLKSYWKASNTYAMGHAMDINWFRDNGLYLLSDSRL